MPNRMGFPSVFLNAATLDVLCITKMRNRPGQAAMLEMAAGGGGSAREPPDRIAPVSRCVKSNVPTRSQPDRRLIIVDCLPVIRFLRGNPRSMTVPPYRQQQIVRSFPGKREIQGQLHRDWLQPGWHVRTSFWQPITMRFSTVSRISRRPRPRETQQKPRGGGRSLSRPTPPVRRGFPAPPGFFDECRRLRVPPRGAEFSASSVQSIVEGAPCEQSHRAKAGGD